MISLKSWGKLRRWTTAHSQSPSLRSVGKLALGSAVSQGVALAATPLITRLYDASSYGVFTVYASMVALLGGLATGKLEAAVVLPPETRAGERTAIAIARTSLLFAGGATFALSALVVGLLLIWPEALPDDLVLWALAAPIAILMTALVSTLSALAVRARSFGELALVAPLQRLAQTATQICSGLGGLGTSGLIAGVFSGVAAAVGALGLSRRRSERVGRSTSLLARGPGIREVWAAYSDFPRHNAPLFLLNTLSVSGPTFVLAIFLPPGEVGYFGLAFAVTSVPVAMIAGNLNPVFVRELASRAGDPEARLNLARRVVVSVSAVSALPFGALMLLGPWIFGIVFGTEWVAAGAVASAMALQMWGRLVSTTVSGAFVVFRRQRRLLVWQASALALVTCVYTVGSLAEIDLAPMVWASSLLMLPMFGVLLWQAMIIVREG